MKSIETKPITLTPIGILHCDLKSLSDVPRSYNESVQKGTIEVLPEFCPGLDGITAGDTILVLFWFQKARRDIFRVHPRGDTSRPKLGVFACRSPVRPNPIALSELKVISIDNGMIQVSGIDALDQTPVLDIKRTIFR